MDDYVAPERDPGVHPGAAELRALATAWAAYQRIAGETRPGWSSVLTDLERAVTAVLDTRYQASIAPTHPADLVTWVEGRHAYTAGEYESVVAGALKATARELAARYDQDDEDLAAAECVPYHLHDALGVIRSLAAGRTVVLDGAGAYRWVTSDDAMAHRLSDAEVAVLRGLDLLPAAL